MGRTGTLDDRRRAAALVLYETGDWSQSDLAETLGVSRSALQRALAGTHRPPPPPHPSNSSYQRGCHCDGCKQAHSAAQAEYRAKDAVPPLTSPSTVPPAGECQA